MNVTPTKAKYRHQLPQLNGGLFLTDGGLETTLIFHEGWDLPAAEAFVLLDAPRGLATLRDYFDRYVPMAVERGNGFVLESPTWRANQDWGAKIGYDRQHLAALNRAAIDLMHEMRSKYETERSPMVISGCVGPRGDGYDPGTIMTPEAAQSYHCEQIGIFRDAGADLVTAITMTNVSEAVGIVQAAHKAGMPSVISFTLETDGCLPTGEKLSEAIKAVDQKTGGGPAYYMINCAHPTHFDDVLEAGSTWVTRLRGLRANSSRCSHAELDNAPELDIGNPEELGEQYRDLLRRFPHINVLGGCCGTDHRHVDCISRACLEAA